MDWHDLIIVSCLTFYMVSLMNDTLNPNAGSDPAGVSATGAPLIAADAIASITARSAGNETVWVHGLRGSRSRRVTSIATARITPSRIHLGAVAAKWLLPPGVTSCLVASHRSDVVLIAASDPAMKANLFLQLGIDRTAGTAIRLDAAGYHRRFLNRGVVWARCGTVGPYRAVKMPQAIDFVKIGPAPESLAAGLYWTPFRESGRHCLTQTEWDRIFSPADHNEVVAVTGIPHPMPQYWNDPPAAVVNRPPTWKARLQGQRRQRTRRTGEHVVIGAGQIAIPDAVMTRVDNPDVIQIGLRRSASGNSLDVVLVPAGVTDPGYEVRRHRLATSGATLRLDCRSAWLRAILAKGSFPAVVHRASPGTPAEIVIRGATRRIHDESELARFPATVQALLSGEPHDASSQLPDVEQNLGISFRQDIATDAVQNHPTSISA